MKGQRGQGWVSRNYVCGEQLLEQVWDIEVLSGRTDVQDLYCGSVRVLWMRKQGAPWGTLQKWCSGCQSNIPRGGDVQTTTEKRGSQSKRAFKGLF